MRKKEKMSKRFDADHDSVMLRNTVPDYSFLKLNDSNRLLIQFIQIYSLNTELAPSVC